MSRFNQYIEMVRLYFTPAKRAAITRLRKKILGDAKDHLRLTFSSREELDEALKYVHKDMRQRQIAGNYGIADKIFNVPKIPVETASLGLTFIREVRSLMKKKQLTSFDKFIMKRFKDNADKIVMIAMARYESFAEIVDEYDMAIRKHNFTGPRSVWGNDIVHQMNRAWDTYQAANLVKGWLERHE
jgi:hypothetical protein